jgi:hypothetical protein
VLGSGCDGRSSRLLLDGAGSFEAEKPEEFWTEWVKSAVFAVFLG